MIPGTVRFGGIIAVLFFLGLDRAEACACCSDAGQRRVGVEKLESDRRAEIDKVRFRQAALLFLNGADGDIKGLDAPAPEYTVKVDRQNDRFVFDLRSREGRGGTLTVLIPYAISIFEIDPRDNTDSGLGPLLYKEWRLTSKLIADGDFKKGEASDRITLILQGRGRGCTTAQDFTHWTLVIDGPATKYSLFGELEKNQ